MTDAAPVLTPDRLRRIAGIFEVALELGPDLRKPYLDALAAQDPDLKRRVLDLLEEAEGDHDATRAEGRQLAEEISKLERIGPWRLLQHLGQGGMGDVFLAERADEHYDRQVAIKLIRKGLDSFEGHRDSSPSGRSSRRLTIRTSLASSTAGPPTVSALTW